MAGSQIDFLMAPQTENGSALASGTVEFYLEGTSTPVTVYAEKALSTSLGTSVTLDSNGTKLCFAATTSFLKLIVKRANGTTLNTFDGIGLTLGGPLASDAYLRDGSLALTGAMPGGGYDLNNLGDVDLASGKSINMNHGHSYSPTSADMIVYGGATGYIRQFIASSLAKTFFGATEIWNWTASTIKALIPIDMDSNKVTNMAAGSTTGDAVEFDQMETADALNLDLAGTRPMTANITLPAATPTSGQAAKVSMVALAPVRNAASGNATALTGTSQEIAAVSLSLPAGANWTWVEVIFTSTLVSATNIEAVEIKENAVSQTTMDNFMSVTTNNSDDAAMVSFFADFVPSDVTGNLDVEFWAKTSGTGDTTGSRRMMCRGYYKIV